MTERRLRQSYDMMLALRSEAAPGRERCPEVERLSALVDRSGSEKARLALLDHVMACPHCHAEFELLRAAHRASARHSAQE
jgi:anti-sigma factor RsiW